MFVMQWQSLLSLTFISTLIVYSSCDLVTAASLSCDTSQPDSRRSHFVLANSSLATTKQKQLSNLFQQLNLTAEQRHKIAQIHRQYKQHIRKKRLRLAKLQQQLSDMMVGTETIELVRAKNQQLVNLRQEINALRFETMLDTREILTLQQRQKFRKLVESQPDL